MSRSAVIVSFARTPIGRFLGELSSVTAPALGAVAIQGAVERANIDPNDVGEVLMGNVCSAGLAQAPARQAAIQGGLSLSTATTTIQKVCASGMKSIMFGAQSIMLGAQDVVVAGGMESMSNVPHYVSVRNGIRLGDGKLVDGAMFDGLTNAVDAGDEHGAGWAMGLAGEACATTYNFTREEQDAYAIASYERARAAQAAGVFTSEIVPVTVQSRRGDTVVDTDGEPAAADLDKLPSLRPAFRKDGTVTAGNASSLNDGAAAVVMMSEEAARERGLSPLARIVGFGDAGRAPIEFTVAPTDAGAVALRMAGMELSDVDYHEINEAFSVVALANMKLMGLDHDRVNVHGGGVSLGHPIGCSGARIVGSLMTVLGANNASTGMASICNGGGGASAIIVERC